MRSWSVAGILAIACCVIAVRASAQAPATPVHAGQLDVLPFPGTPDASPQTEIDFPALAPSQLVALTVVGSRSGSHTGRLIAVPDGGGSAFVPARRFLDGDQVSVRATLSSPEAGGASGAPNATELRFGFTVADAVSEEAMRTHSEAHSKINPVTFTHTFHSEPWLHPPILGTTGKLPDPGQGDIILDAQNSIQAGPVILDPSGRLVWFRPSHHIATFNVEVQRYQGQPVLTFWQGAVIQGYGEGTDVLLNHSYEQIATVRGANGLKPDLHEFRVTPQGNALVATHRYVQADLRSVGGSRNAMLVDSIIQEINIRTGRLLWEWHAYGHVPLGDSYAGKPGTIPYDFFHLNSIQQLRNGNFLISARHMSAIYEISRRTGTIQWQLGGKHSTFQIGSGANFEFQHDAHMQPDGTITVFDNGYGLSQAESQSRALRIRLNMKTMQATLVRAYTNRPPALAMNQGSVQVLPDANLFVGWGNAAFITQFSPRGRRLFRVRLGGPIRSYRAYRFPWTGEPTTKPSIAVTPAQSGTTVYASWNGATDVASWQVMAGSGPTALLPVAQRASNGFETGIATSTPEPYVAVEALDQNGHVLATSPTVTP